MGIIVAIMAGILIAALLMRRSSIEAKRSRQLRNLAGDRANLDLSSLEIGGDVDSDATDNAKPDETQS